MDSATSSGASADGRSGSSLGRCCQRPSTSSQVSGARGTGSPWMVTLMAVASAAQQLIAKRVSRYPSRPGLLRGDEADQPDAHAGQGMRRLVVADHVLAERQRHGDAVAVGHQRREQGLIDPSVAWSVGTGLPGGRR